MDLSLATNYLDELKSQYPSSLKYSDHSLKIF